MIRKKFGFALVVLLFGGSFNACSDDDKQAEELVQPTGAETPAAPPEDTIPDSSIDPATSTVYFAFDDYTLSSDAQDILNRMAEYMKSNSSSVVQIEGHCDERGSIEYNLALGERRAQSVKNYLTQMGVDGARLPTISYGEEKPSAEGHDESAWSQNRRAQFVLSQP